MAGVGPWKRFAAVKARADELIHREIAERRVAPDLAERTDVLSKLLVADPDQSDDELRDHLITLLLAGHETTASTLAWTCHDLARRPELLARVQRAADEGDEAYLEAVVKESMRLRPVIGEVARRLTRPTTVAGHELPAGVVVFPSIELVHRRPGSYPSPEDFRPERFLGSTPPPATWIPFGGGIRRCLGAALAMVEAKAVLKVVLRRVDIAPVGRPEWPRARNVTTVPGAWRPDRGPPALSGAATAATRSRRRRSRPARGNPRPAPPRSPRPSGSTVQAAQLRASSQPRTVPDAAGSAVARQTMPQSRKCGYSTGAAAAAVSSASPVVRSSGRLRRVASSQRMTTTPAAALASRAPVCRSS